MSKTTVTVMRGEPYHFRIRPEADETAHLDIRAEVLGCLDRKELVAGEDAVLADMVEAAQRRARQGRAEVVVYIAQGELDRINPGWREDPRFEVMTEGGVDE